MEADLSSVSSCHSCPPKIVADYFARSLYAILLKDTTQAHRFYVDASVATRPGSDGKLRSVTTVQEINYQILSENWEDFREVELKSIDAQAYQTGGVVVLITGTLISRKGSDRRFAETVFLAQQPNGYHILTDIFRFVDEDWAGDQNSASSPLQSCHPQDVAIFFTNYYYQILSKSPDIIYNFYLKRPGQDQKLRPASTLQGINDQILSEYCKGGQNDIKSIDGEASLNGGIIILVTGTWRNQDIFKSFVETFFLAPQPGGFYVLNHILRYDDDDAPLASVSCEEEDSLESWYLVEDVQLDSSNPDEGASPSVTNNPDPSLSNHVSSLAIKAKTIWSWISGGKKNEKLL